MTTMFDISRPLVTGVPTWPGDTPFSYEVSWTKEQSGSVNVGKLTMSIHTGTHIDAPFHFDNEGRKVMELDLELYIGLARVIEISGKSSIGAEELKAFELDGITRLLIRTNSWTNPNEFPTEITYLRDDAGTYLAEKGIRLIGVDVPSVDPLDSKELAAHHTLHANDIHILEGIDLAKIAPGDYELIALPLPLVEADGSPVRAILRPLT
ncbi:arylformamidase [Paenibacillus sp. CGMCC 1.16610]|uniref:Kynurenine formamidase n=1 Tax=Paenibacillus anseongense TaxID=2682845 RepID=A0ABW9UE31_9BACL|nr:MULTISPECIES: arylformamidase [Paenibacillus]MBA2943721.1 arylformamidase [Paenibacillus sp. CGMCC 1.16610]MVQ37627.1 arylformamidase [Paenibacillus anseongense]